MKYGFTMNKSEKNSIIIPDGWKCINTDGERKVYNKYGKLVFSFYPGCPLHWH